MNNQQNPLLLPMSFDSLELIQIPVTIAGKEYFLQEADEAAAVKWRDAVINSTRVSDQGKPTGFSGLAATEVLLVSLCLFEIYYKKNSAGEEERRGRPVPLSVLNTWKPKIISALFQRAQEISELSQKEDMPSLLRQLEATQEKIDKVKEGEDSSKNGQNGTTGTSDSQKDSEGQSVNLSATDSLRDLNDRH